MGQPGEHQEQSQLAQLAVAQRGGDADLIGHLFQRGQQAEDWTQGGRASHGVLVEVAAQGAPQGGNAGRGPVGEVGQCAVFDFSVPAEGLAQQDGRRRIAVGHGGDVHATQLWHLSKLKHLSICQEIICYLHGYI